MAGHAERAGLYCIREFVCILFDISLFAFFLLLLITLHLPQVSFSSHA